MMVVMAVMAADLHLLFTLSGNAALCQMFWLRIPQPGRNNNPVHSATARLVLSAWILCISVAWPQAAPATHVPPPPETRVDINHATVDELCKVPGLTRSWALRIIRFRPYRTKQDLLDNGILPSDVYSRIRDYVIAHHDPR